MQRKRPEGLRCPCALICKFLAGIFVLLIFATVSPSQASGNPSASTDAPSFDPLSFSKEMSRLNRKLEVKGWSSEELRSFRDSLPRKWVVNSAGRRFDVPTGSLVSKLRSAEAYPQDQRKILDEAREYLGALAAEAETLSAEPPQDSKPAHAKLKAILARREFSASRQPNLLEQLGARINELLVQALSRIFGHVGGARSFGNVLLWIGICAAAVFVAYWIFRNWFRSARMQEMAIQAAAAPARSWQEWVFAARDAAEHGDYRMAVHCAYWAGVARLQELGALPLDRSKTPREYLRTLGLPGRAGSPVSERRQALSTLTSLLERFWYGGQSATEAEFRDSLAHLEALGCHLL